MNQRLLSSVIRKLLPEMIIGVALAAIAYFLFTKPLILRAAEASAKADALTGQLALLQKSPSEAPKSDSAKRIENLTAVMIARAESVRDPGSFFQTLSTLATPLQVQIDQVSPSTPRPLRTSDGKLATSQPIQQPATNTTGPAMGPGAPSLQGPAMQGPAMQGQGMPGPIVPATPPPPTDIRTAYSIRIAGRFDRCLTFIDQLQTSLAFTTIKSVTFTKAGDDKPGYVFVTIETDHAAVSPSTLKPPAAPINAISSNNIPPGMPIRPAPQSPNNLMEGPRP